MESPWCGRPRTSARLSNRFVFLLLALLPVVTACDTIEKLRPEAHRKKQPEPGILDGGRAPTPSIAPPQVAPPPLIAPIPGAPGSFADLATKANPAVVFVRTVQSRQRGFHRVLQPGSGSGFIFDASGKILTNHHVVSGAHAIQVELEDGRALMAQVVGADPLTDLAVLSVPQTDLPALPLGDSDEIQVGDWVLAIGNPFGLEHTVSAGIISAKERTGRDVQLGDPDAYYSFLQTDASINPGNSGGPLIDMAGRVVGVNTAINQAANNIGFAIPVNMIRQLLPRLLKDGRVQRAAIGVQVSDVTLDDVKRFGLPHRKGAFIAQVVPGSPAEKAKMRPGDVVLEFHGVPIESPEDLRWEASLAPINEDVFVVVLREGKETRLSLKPAPLRMR